MTKCAKNCDGDKNDNNWLAQSNNALVDFFHKLLLYIILCIGIKKYMVKFWTSGKNWTNVG